MEKGSEEHYAYLDGKHFLMKDMINEGGELALYLFNKTKLYETLGKQLYPGKVHYFLQGGKEGIKVCLNIKK